jgi:lysine 2-monooxygenase
VSVAVPPLVSALQPAARRALLATAPVSALIPDFPFEYDRYLAHDAGLGAVPPALHGEKVAIVGAGLSGLVAAYELMRMGLHPLVYEAERIGGRLRSQRLRGLPGDVVAELGGMRFPASAGAFQHYLGMLGLTTRPFPNPLDGVHSTVVELQGERYYAESAADLPAKFHEVSRAWDRTLREQADFAAMQEAIGARDLDRIKRLWNPLVARYDSTSFYRFLCDSPHFRSFKKRELFGLVGFGSGGWDTDFPNSILEVLRVVYPALDDNHGLIEGGADQLPLRLWSHVPERMAHWPAGTSLAALNRRVFGERGYGGPVVSLRRAAGGDVVVEDGGERRQFKAVVMAGQVRLLQSNIPTDPRLLSSEMWTAVTTAHYMHSAKVFVWVKKPFWKEKGPDGRDRMSITLTDRITRSTYLFDYGDDRPGAICLSYTWNDDAIKVLPLTPEERERVMLEALRHVYPDVDLDAQLLAEPETVSWTSERRFIGAFKANLPGQYRYQRRLFCNFMKQPGTRDADNGLFLSGDDVTWTGGWSEGAVHSGLNAAWGVMHRLGGRTAAGNPGPGDLFDRLQPCELPDDDDPLAPTAPPAAQGDQQ